LGDQSRGADLGLRFLRPWLELLGFCFFFPQLFPLSSTVGVQVGHAGKFRESAFDEITHSADAYPHVLSKNGKKRCHKLDRPAIVCGDRNRG
jgi:hypothetical protein